MKYWIEVMLTMADEVEANSLEEAIDILIEDAIRNGEWDYRYEELEEDEE